MNVHSSILRFAAYLWAAPNTVLGCVIGLLCLCSGGRVGVCRGVIEFSGGALGALFSGRAVRVIAVTLGHAIVGIDRDELCRVREHERVHVRQYERWGPFFLPAYALSSIWQALRGRHFYLDNVFEREAFAAEDQV